MNCIRAASVILLPSLVCLRLAFRSAMLGGGRPPRRLSVSLQPRSRPLRRFHTESSMPSLCVMEQHAALAAGSPPPGLQPATRNAGQACMAGSQESSAPVASTHSAGPGVTRRCASALRSALSRRRPVTPSSSLLKRCVSRRGLRRNESSHLGARWIQHITLGSSEFASPLQNCTVVCAGASAGRRRWARPRQLLRPDRARGPDRVRAARWILLPGEL